MEETNVLYQIDQNSYQELMEEAQKLAHFGGWEVNIVTGAVKWSSEMYNLLGYDPMVTEATFNNFVKKLHREDILYVKKNLENLLSVPSTDTYDFRIVNKDDNTVKYLRTGIVVKRNRKGRAITMTGFSQDITEKKLAEKKIEKINKELNTFFKVIDDVFFSVDVPANKLIQISQGCEKLFEYSIQEMQADFSLWNKAQHPDDREIIGKGNGDLARGETIVSQYRIIRKDNSTRWVESKIIPGLDTHGRLLRLDGVTRDITERKMLELEREKITADLVQRNKDQEQFNYMISHNLRAPVANITGLLEILNEPGIEEGEKNYVLSGISTSIKSLDSVIIDMNQVLQAREFINETREDNNLEELVNDIKMSINNIIHNEDVKIKCHFDVERVFSIRSYLYSIFYNLILNSIKYRQIGISPAIVIKSSLHKNKIKLTFTDNGKGIDLETNGKQLFRLYKRFDTSVEGKGMGLFMVKTQIESLGGRIEVKSELDKGTQFIIELPV